MADQEFILAPATVSVKFELQPARNCISSLNIINQAEELSGLSDWVYQTHQKLSPERRRTNLLCTYVLPKPFYPRQDFPDFAAYLDALAAIDANFAGDEMRKMYCEELMGADPELLLADKDVFLKAVQDTWGEKHAKKGYELDLSLYADIHDLLQDPQRMLDMVVEHMQYMWNHHLKAEWERALPMLQESVEAFRQLDFSGQTALEAARTVTGRDLAGYWSDLDNAEKVVFIPSAHHGPYVSIYPESGVVYLLFGARVPEGVKTKSPALSRSELLVQLSALADDTRLTILELLTRHDELCAQDIINLLNLSQSSASRHLRQLTATGYLVERRREVAKCYSLNPDRFDVTLVALKMFMKGRG